MGISISVTDEGPMIDVPANDYKDDSNTSVPGHLKTSQQVSHLLIQDHN